MTKHPQLDLFLATVSTNTPSFASDLFNVAEGLTQPVTWEWMIERQKQVEHMLELPAEELEVFGYSRKEFIQSIKSIWEQVRRRYFKDYFLNEILLDETHRLYSFFRALAGGIFSHDSYLNFEQRWEQEVIPYCSGLDDDFSNLARLALSKAYTLKKNDYYSNVLRVEIKDSPQNPFYWFVHLVDTYEVSSDDFYFHLEQAFVEVERLILKQNEQYQRRLFQALKPYALAHKQAYYKASGIMNGWNMVLSEVERHPQWQMCHRLISELLPDQLDSDATYHQVSELFHRNLSKCESEMGYFDWVWIQKELEKRLRFLEKRLRLQSENHFAIWLKQLREEHGLSYRQLEQLSGVSSTYLHRLETGAQKCPTIPTAKKIAQAFGIPFEEIAKFLDSELADASPVGEHELDLLNLLAVKPLKIGAHSLSKKQRQSLTQLLTLIMTETFDGSGLSDTIELLNLIKQIQKK